MDPRIGQRIAAAQAPRQGPECALEHGDLSVTREQVFVGCTHSEVREVVGNIPVARRAAQRGVHGVYMLAQADVAEARPFQREHVIERHVERDAGIAPQSQRQQAAHCNECRMSISRTVDGTMQPHAFGQGTRPAWIGRSPPEVAEQAAGQTMSRRLREQGMREIIHAAATGSGDEQAIGYYRPAFAERAPLLESSPALSFPDVSGPLSLRGVVGVIEAVIDLPEAADARPGTAIICHPHPLHGGTLHNKVVTIIERSLRELGLRTVRFNFRGVGASEGTHDETALGETLDLEAIAHWVARERPRDALWLAGFSFGASVAARASLNLPCEQLITVAPPVDKYAFIDMAPPTCPWLVIQGDDDDVVEPATVTGYIEGLENPPTLVRMPDAGHFFHRKLMDLRGAIKNGVKANLPPSDSAANPA